ncbi:MAG: hypothetical protein EA403_07460 [Spirochaetaceae bacterium]|nr:MAG: hypothetical protein EA403_07460 [Spirochaetaceae bacterium]
MGTLLAVDVGTTNWKVAAFHPDGRLIGTMDSAALVHTDEKGQYYDPEELWNTVCTLLRQLQEKYRLSGVGAISVTGMAESGVPIDREGRPVYPAIPWYDPRSTPQAQEMNRTIGPDRLYELTGLDPNPVFSVPKIAWIRDNEPERYARVATWLPIADYVNYRLTGEIATDYSQASRTLAFELDGRRWSSEILETLGLETSIFPPVLASGKPLGSVTSVAARETGLSQGTPVVMGGHDHHCAFLAAGALIDDVVLDSSGTVESIMTLLPPDRPRPRRPNGMRVGFFLDPSRYATMGGILASGASVEWVLRSIWADDEKGSPDGYHGLIEAARSVPPGCNGLCFVPHLLGAGAPIWDPGARGAFVGLRAEHSRAHLSRAVFEGLCLELRNLLDAVESSFGARVTALNTVGGGARNHFWQQLKADVTGLTVNIPDVSESTALGAALLAGVGIGVYRDMVDASQSTVRLQQSFHPNSEHRATYDRLRDVYAKIYPQIREISRSLGTV